MVSKPAGASKTLWFNAITILALAASAFGLDLGLDDETKATLAAGVVAAVNIALRIVTHAKIQWGRK